MVFQLPFRARALVTRSNFQRLVRTNAKNQHRNFETLAVKSVAEYVTSVELNRPDKLNAMNTVFWKEIGDCFRQLNDDTKCRAIVLSGSGRMFTSGLDFSDMSQIMGVYQSEDDVARKFKKLLDFVKPYQAAFTSLEKCCKPVISAVHNACIGGGVDLITAADIRYCTSDAWFQIKEVDLGLAADVGTLQRLPKVVGNDSLVRELAFSARKLPSDEAKSCGLVSRVFPDKESMMEAAIQMAATIAKKSPVAVQGTKIHLIYSRDHTVEESLHYQAIWNAFMLQSGDLMKASMAQINKSETTFEDF